MSDLQTVIDSAWENRNAIGPDTKGEVRLAVDKALSALDSGEARIAEKIDGEWTVHQWLKKAVLLSFRLNPMELISGAPGGANWWDKVPSKFAGWGAKEFESAGFRAVPGAIVRRGAFIAPGAVLMPSFVNIGARVGEGTMVDTWATVISMGVFLGASTKIVDRASGEVIYGRVPAYSVVVPGTLPGKDGGPGLACAVIVKRVDERTRSKTSINELLRD
jgi:2,3,4,5-tetrahydropyridine-2-carboxylate N-succinyltransferase